MVIVKDLSLRNSAQEIYDEIKNANIKIDYLINNAGFGLFGEFTETSLYQHQDKSGKIRGWIYSVHVGSWGGMLTRILAFIAALIGAALPLTGYYLWMRKFIRQLIGTKK